MESLNTALECITPGCYMASVDLKDAFFSIPMFPPHQKYLKFIYRDIMYKFTCMPQGYGPSMRIFTKMLKPAFSYLREKNFSSVVYVDDNLLLGDTYTECSNNVTETVDLLSKLGYTIHADKSIFIPTQEIVFLGFILNSNTMTISLTDEKKKKIKNMCIDTIKNPCISIRRLASIIGNMVSAFPTLPHGRLFYRSLEFQKIDSLSIHKGNFDKNILVSSDAIQDITWWRDHIDLATTSILKPKITVTIYTDASHMEWGIHCNKISNGDRWSIIDKDLHINILELKAVFIGLKAFCSDKKNIHVQIMSDSSTAIYYINNMGGI